MGRYPEEPRQAGETGCQEPQAVQSPAPEEEQPPCRSCWANGSAGSIAWENVEILVDTKWSTSQRCALAMLHMELHWHERRQRVDGSDDFPVFNTHAAGSGV